MATGSTDWRKEHLTTLVKASEEATKRFRFVFIVINIAGIIILAAQFNSSLAWLHRVTARKDIPPDVKKLATDVLHKDLYVVSAPLLGIKFSAFDQSVIGSFALMVLAVWFFLAARRENHVIKTVKEMGDTTDDKDCVAFLLHGVQHAFVLQPRTKRDEPFLDFAVKSTALYAVLDPLRRPRLRRLVLIEPVRPEPAVGAPLWLGEG
jgi:hypothetical protein